MTTFSLGLILTKKNRLPMRQKIVLSTVLILFFLSSSAQDNPLFIPDTLSGPTYNLTMQKGTHQFWPGVNTNTMGFNGNILGPTLIFNANEFITLNVDNQLGETTTVHWHGMHVAPEDDGGPHTPILANETWSPDFTVLDDATTFWYHPHLHEKTMQQVTNGLAGMIIVRDELESNLSLPRTYGEDDIPLIIQDRTFQNNQIRVVPLGDSVMVNGVFRPYKEVPASMVRFRVLNGSSERTYNLGLSNGDSFKMIGSDGGLLESPVTLTRLIIAPGERAELIVDFSGKESTSLNLMSFASELPTSIFGGPRVNGAPGAATPLDGADFSVIQFNVIAASSNAITSIPETFRTITKPTEASVDITRQKRFVNPASPGSPFTINGIVYDMNVMNDTVRVNNVEIWELKNESNVAHPFHIHDIQFYILDRNGNAPDAHEQGKKDVVLVDANETVRFITHFTDFTNETVPYMYHCHILGHEDSGMMGQFLVLPEATANEEELDYGFPKQMRLNAAFPNPFNPSTTIELELANSSSVELSVFNSLGQLVEIVANKEFSAGKHQFTINASNWASGVYLIRARSGNTTLTQAISLIK